MKPIEEQLWEFIDGTCSADEKTNIEKLLQTDPAIQMLHQEFLSISKSLKSMELEEPSFRFTQNVMDRVALEPAPKALKTKVDKRIINGIGGFFIITLVTLIGLMFSQMSWSSVSEVQFNMPQINLSEYFGSTFVQGAMIAVVILALASVDRFLHYRRHMHDFKS
jgi:anti-sigma factor RsiW